MKVTVKTLRHYEQKELLIPDEVDEWTGYRRPDAETQFNTPVATAWIYV